MTDHCYTVLLIRLLSAVGRLSPERAAVLGVYWARWANGRTFGQRGCP